MSEGRCRYCNARILWATTPNDKWMPLDAEPNSKGNIVVNANGCTGPDGTDAAVDTSVRYMPHHATCPDAKSFRKKK